MLAMISRKVGSFHCIAQVGEAFQQGDARAHQLFKIEEKGNEIGALDFAADRSWLCFLLPWRSIEVDSGALQALFEVDQVGGILQTFVRFCRCWSIAL